MALVAGWPASRLPRLGRQALGACLGRAAAPIAGVVRGRGSAARGAAILSRRLARPATAAEGDAVIRLLPRTLRGTWLLAGMVGVAGCGVLWWALPYRPRISWPTEKPAIVH